MGEAFITDAEGACKYRIEGSADGLMVFEPLRDGGIKVGSFECTTGAAMAAADESPLRIITNEGHLLVNRISDYVWFVSVVHEEKFSDTCVVGRDAYVAAIKKALGDAPVR